MNAKRALQSIGILLAALALILMAANQLALIPAATPPPTVLGQSFSVTSGNPLTTVGINPADILGLGGAPLIACETLGLLCEDPATDSVDDIRALSYGWDFMPAAPGATDIPPLQFSVALASQGLAGSAVRIEAQCRPAEPQADVFDSSRDKTNVQDLDGNGMDCSSNTGYPLYLTESTTSDNIDALERDPCQYIDLNCDGRLENPVYFVLAPGSPSLSVIGASPVDILVAGVAPVPMLWANGITDLGLSSGDVIDALCLRENGNGIFDAGDLIYFSLAAGSPSLGTSFSAADVLKPKPLLAAIRHSALGLAFTDDLDALTCMSEAEFISRHLPLMYTR